MHTANLALRLFLEIAALGGLAVLSLKISDHWWRYLAVIAVLSATMAVWGIFAVPNDPSRSGGAPIPVAGWVRLALEFAILFGGAWAYYLAGYNFPAISLTLLIILHYALWAARISWLLQQ